MGYTSRQYERELLRVAMEKTMQFRELYAPRHVHAHSSEIGSSNLESAPWPSSTRLPALLLLCLLLGGVAFLSSGPAAGLVLDTGKSQRGVQPLATCSYTPLSLSISGSGNVEDIRPFPSTSGDGYFQFAPAAPLT